MGASCVHLGSVLRLGKDKAGGGGARCNALVETNGHAEGPSTCQNGGAMGAVAGSGVAAAVAVPDWGSWGRGAS